MNVYRIDSAKLAIDLDKVELITRVVSDGWKTRVFFQHREDPIDIDLTDTQHAALMDAIAAARVR